MGLGLGLGLGSGLGLRLGPIQTEVRTTLAVPPLTTHYLLVTTHHASGARHAADRGERALGRRKQGKHQHDALCGVTTHEAGGEQPAWLGLGSGSGLGLGLELGLGLGLGLRARVGLGLGLG